MASGRDVVNGPGGNRRAASAAALLVVVATVLMTAWRAEAQPPGPTFSKDVAPIFFKHCTSCHRPGDIAPMSLLTYGDARPWASAILKRVVERSMPPWFADPRYGTFQNERRLTQDELDTISHWIASGAPEGNPTDAPPPPLYTEGWSIGTPDAVFETPKDFDIPATGAVDLRFFQIPTGFAEDKWIQAVEVRPGNRAHVHHVNMYYQEPEPGGPSTPPSDARRPEGSTTPPQRLGSSLAVFAGGTDPLILPPGAARRMPAGSLLLFEIHYVTNGTAARDRTKIGLRFASGRPRNEIQAFAMSNSKFVIPPGSPDHVVQAKGAFDRPLKIWSILPHMHLRGASIEYRLVYPDGHSQIVLSVPHYDSHWETNYTFAEPLLIPTDTLLEATAHFDNSAANRANPDPTQEVHWGWKPSEEMMFSYVSFSLAEGP